MPKKNTTVNAYILLDRSGSMSGRWDEALSSVNAYVGELKKAKATLAVFDGMSGLKFDVLRDNVDSEKWEKVTEKEASPRGGTPLFDAIGRIVALADKEDHEKTVIVVMTDGGENESREITKAGATAAVERCKAKGWEVIFLGADFNAFGEAASVGLGMNKTLNMSAGLYGSSMRSLAEKTTAYATMGCAIDFDETDRVKASKTTT